MAGTPGDDVIGEQWGVVQDPGGGYDVKQATKSYGAKCYQSRTPLHTGILKYKTNGRTACHEPTVACFDVICHGSRN